MSEALNLTTSSAAHGSGIRWWPTIIGLGFALAVGLGVGGGFPAIVLVCAVIYLLAAVTARPGAAWLGFLVTSPAVAIGPILDAEWLSLAIIGAFGLVLVVVGVARGTWRTPANRIQLFGVVGFGAVALGAYLVQPLLAGILIAVGLAAHAAWDIVHHRRNAVVSRSYAEFCAALDITLAVVVLLLTAGIATSVL
jgi:hypothetical protein